MKLYHATFKKNVKSILEKGLLPGQPANFDGMEMLDCLYFAFNPNSSTCFVESADTFNDCSDEELDDYEIVMFEVDTKDLDLTKVGYDWNNRCEYEDEIISITYHGVIKPECLTIVENIDDIDETYFDGIRKIDDDGCYIWEKIGTIFDEEVETNANWGN
jgi:hypothetical protein